MIREFARHIGRVSALAQGRRIAVRKSNKHTWVCAPTDQPITIAYEVYAWDLSVRAAHLDQTHGFFNGNCVFMLPLGHEQRPCTVDILPPAHAPDWRVITGLKPARGTPHMGFGTYTATNYDELIDCPVEMGHFTHARFKAHNTVHEVAITGTVPNLDIQRLTQDLTRICETQLAFFEPRTKQAPFNKYRFLTMAAADGYGGLEHRNATALLCKQTDLPYKGMKQATQAYRNFLGLASHEYFHSWHVKRIKPAAFVPYDLTQENYTQLLWVFEGFTSYYDDLLVARSGLLTEAQYLEVLSKTFSHVLQRPSRLKHSVAEASFDAWIKYYRPDENAPNSLVSYYQKGALVALAIDLTLRAKTKGRRSLDDVMRLMWRDYKAAGNRYRGITEEGMASIIERATGINLARDLHAWTQQPGDPDYAALLLPLGLELTRLPVLDSPAFVLMGCTTAASGDTLSVSSVYDHSPARLAGLSAGDTFVAMDQVRIHATGFANLLARYTPGDTVALTIFRKDILMTLSITLATKPPLRYCVRAMDKQKKAALILRKAWLKGCMAS